MRASCPRRPFVSSCLRGSSLVFSQPDAASFIAGLCTRDDERSYDRGNHNGEGAMKGVVFLGDRKLELRDFPDPTPGPGEVVLEIRASGMCGSDLKFYRASGGG